jgi:hypothetical protein
MFLLRGSVRQTVGMVNATPIPPPSRQILA